MTELTLPFSAVVGQADAKLALLLATIEPALGGVLLRGDKGSAKTTLARSLAGLLPHGAPFVECPLSATEDRLIGTIDIAAVLNDRDVRPRRGLLAEANGGVLYVDEINLLADHLVDALLDVAVSGVNIIERDGVSHRFPARFVLVASMNPEEGELRPQLLDRFGLCVNVIAPTDIDERVDAMRRRLGIDACHDAIAEDVALAASLHAATAASVPHDVLVDAARLAIAVGAEGLRADLALVRAAAAHAGLRGRTAADRRDLEIVAPLVLTHRARRHPFDPPSLAPDDLDAAMRDAFDEQPAANEQHEQNEQNETNETTEQPEQPERRERGEDPIVIGNASAAPPRRRPDVELVRGSRGSFVRDVPIRSAGDAIAVLPTVRELARHPGETTHEHLRSAVRTERASQLVVLTVDLSGSMGGARASAATGAVIGLLDDAYQHRDRVALVGFRNDKAEVLLAPTASVEVARNRLGTLATGGNTPLADGLRAALRIAVRRSAGTNTSPFIALLTDARATGQPASFDDALAAASAIRHAAVPSVVLDCECVGNGVRLGLAERIADAMGADWLPLHDLEPTRLAAAINRARGTNG